MTIIIGIDPGSRLTGFGVIEVRGNQSFYRASGCLKITAENSGDRLQQIFSGIKQVVQQHQPQEAAIEQIFMSQNPSSALKLGQARGAAIVALELPIAEYSARQVKQAIVGYGAAKKDQVQHMVKRLLNINEELQADAADALAIALCHAHSRLSLRPLTVRRKKQTSWRDFRPEEI